MKVNIVRVFTFLMEGFDTSEGARGKIGYGLIMSWRGMLNRESVHVHHYVNAISSI